MLQNFLAVFSIDIVRGFIQNCDASGNYRRELFIFGNELNPITFVLKTARQFMTTQSAGNDELVEEQENQSADGSSAADHEPFHNASRITFRCSGFSGGEIISRR